MDDTKTLKIKLSMSPKAVDELKKLYDIRKAYQRDELLKAMENSSRSYDEILAFITSEDVSEDEENRAE